MSTLKDREIDYVKYARANLVSFFEAYDRLPDRLQCLLHNQRLPQIREVREALRQLTELLDRVTPRFDDNITNAAKDALQNMTNSEQAFLALHIASTTRGRPVLAREVADVLNRIGFNTDINRISATLAALRKRGFVSSGPAPKRLSDGLTTQHLWDLTAVGREQALDSPVLDHLNALYREG